ncbi:MAG: hypothetical protein M0R21_13620, partial [Lentimicrobiaceae bacterium]|nr:hypothetical protein [Lentimicrobiaceae bacterium]
MSKKILIIQTNPIENSFCGLIDKNDADRPFKCSNSITLEHLKAMNKKFAFIAVPKSPKKV